MEPGGRGHLASAVSGIAAVAVAGCGTGARGVRIRLNFWTFLALVCFLTKGVRVYERKGAQLGP